MEIPHTKSIDRVHTWVALALIVGIVVAFIILLAACQAPLR